MTISGQIAIAGVHEHPTRWAPEKTEAQIMAESARGALEDCGLSLSDVDGLFAASMTMGIMGVVGMSEYLNIKPRYLDGTNIGGSSFVAHVNHAAAAIHAGLCEVALILLALFLVGYSRLSVSHSRLVEDTASWLGTDEPTYHVQKPTTLADRVVGVPATLRTNPPLLVAGPPETDVFAIEITDVEATLVPRTARCQVHQSEP